VARDMTVKNNGSAYRHLSPQSIRMLYMTERERENDEWCVVGAGCGGRGGLRLQKGDLTCRETLP